MVPATDNHSWPKRGATQEESTKKKKSLDAGSKVTNEGSVLEAGPSNLPTTAHQSSGGTETESERSELILAESRRAGDNVQKERVCQMDNELNAKSRPGPRGSGTYTEPQADWGETTSGRRAPLSRNVDEARGPRNTGENNQNGTQIPAWGTRRSTEELRSNQAPVSWEPDTATTRREKSNNMPAKTPRSEQRPTPRKPAKKGNFEQEY
jgi:hypothetical protein